MLMMLNKEFFVLITMFIIYFFIMQNRHHSLKHHCKTCSEYHASKKKVASCRNLMIKKQKELIKNQSLNNQEAISKQKNSEKQVKEQSEYPLLVEQPITLEKTLEKIIVAMELNIVPDQKDVQTLLSLYQQYSEVQTRSLIGTQINLQKTINEIITAIENNKVPDEDLLYILKSGYLQNRMNQKKKVDKLAHNLAHNYIREIQTGEKEIAQKLRFRRQLKKEVKRRQRKRLQDKRKENQYEQDQMRVNSRFVHGCQKRYKRRYNPISQRQLQLRWKLTLQQDFRLFFMVNKETRKKFKLDGLSQKMLVKLKIMDLEQYPQKQLKKLKKKKKIEEEYEFQQDNSQELFQKIWESQKWYKKYQKQIYRKQKVQKENQQNSKKQIQIQIKDKVVRQFGVIYSSLKDYVQRFEKPKIEQIKEPFKSNISEIISLSIQYEKQKVRQEQLRVQRQKLKQASIINLANILKQMEQNLNQSNCNDHEVSTFAQKSVCELQIAEKVDWGLVNAKREQKRAEITGSRTLYGVFGCIGKKFKFKNSDELRENLKKAWILKQQQKPFSQVYFDSGRRKKIIHSINKEQTNGQLCCGTPVRNKKQKNNQKENNKTTNFKQLNQPQPLFERCSKLTQFQMQKINITEFTQKQFYLQSNKSLRVLRQRTHKKYSQVQFKFQKQKPYCFQCGQILRQIECLKHYKFICLNGHEIAHQCGNFNKILNFLPKIYSTSLKQLSIKLKACKLQEKQNNFKQVIKNEGFEQYLHEYKYSPMLPELIKCSLNYIDEYSKKLILQNRQNQMLMPLEIKNCRQKIKGKGVFATKKIQKGSLIGSYIGQITTNEDCNASYKSLYTLGYLISDTGIIKQMLINPKKKTNFARFINGSKSHEEANCRTSTTIMQLKNGNCQIFLYIYSTKDILEQEELSYEYGQNFWEQ